jgi:hypothetical protein
MEKIFNLNLQPMKFHDSIKTTNDLEVLSYLVFF